jgi:hypothetical protein
VKHILTILSVLYGKVNPDTELLTASGVKSRMSAHLLSPWQVLYRTWLKVSEIGTHEYCSCGTRRKRVFFLLGREEQKKGVRGVEGRRKLT